MRSFEPTSGQVNKEFATETANVDSILVRPNRIVQKLSFILSLPNVQYPKGQREASTVHRGQVLQRLKSLTFVLSVLP